MPKSKLETPSEGAVESLRIISEFNSKADTELNENITIRYLEQMDNDAGLSEDDAIDIVLAQQIDNETQSGEMVADFGKIRALLNVVKASRKLSATDEKIDRICHMAIDAVSTKWNRKT